MSLLSRFTKSSSLSPIRKLINAETSNLERSFENSVNDLFSGGLRSVGLSDSVVEELNSRFGDSFKHDLADKYFRTATSEINRVTRLDIFNGVSSRSAETSIGAIDRLDDIPLDVEGVSDVYQYPNQIGKYYVSLKFREYVRTTPQAGASLNFKNAIVLPIPNNLREDFDLNIDSQATGVSGGLADVIQNSTSSGGGDFKVSSSAGALAYSYLSQNGLLTVPGGESLLGLNAQNQTTAITQFIGSVPNPHLATIFNGVNMRQFSFEWTFSPRNEKESRDLEVLIEQIKANSLPAFSTLGTAVLQYPFLCFVELQPWASNGDPLIDYKPALITNVSINRSPNGIPSFFEGTNLPTFIHLTLNFMETEYFTSNDFGRLGRTAEEGDKLALGAQNIAEAGADLLEVLGVEDGTAAIENTINRTDEALSTGSTGRSDTVIRNPDGSIQGDG